MKTYVHLSKEADVYVKSLEAENSVLRAELARSRQLLANSQKEAEGWRAKVTQ